MEKHERKGLYCRELSIRGSSAEGSEEKTKGILSQLWLKLPQVWLNLPLWKVKMHLILEARAVGAWLPPPRFQSMLLAAWGPRQRLVTGQRLEPVHLQQCLVQPQGLVVVQVIGLLEETLPV